VHVTTAAQILAEALELAEAKRDDLAAQVLGIVEPSAGASVENEVEIRHRADQARGGVAGIAWSEVKRSLVK